MRWQDGRRETQHSRNVPLLPLAGKEGRAHHSPRRRERECLVEPRMVSAEASQVMDFVTYAAFLAVTPEKHAK